MQKELKTDYKLNKKDKYSIIGTIIGFIIGWAMMSGLFVSG